MFFTKNMVNMQNPCHHLWSCFALFIHSFSFICVVLKCWIKISAWPRVMRADEILLSKTLTYLNEKLLFLRYIFEVVRMYLQYFLA